MKNAGRAGIVPKDDFDINIKYKRLDAVMHDKSLYIAKKDVPLGTLPTDTTYWMKSIYGNKEPIATTATVGVVKPDGDTITVDEDGTLHGQSKVDEMTGATADADGTSGTVPVPKAGQEDLFLSGDGTWREAGTNITVDSELSKESTNPIENRAVAEELEKKLNSDGDSKDLTTTFTSNDSTNVTEWTDVGLLTSGEKHSSLFQKVATMFKNIRYLYHMLGTADISALGEGANIGTVTGAISKLNSDLNTNLNDKIPSQFPTTFKTRCPLGGNGLYYGQSFNVVLPYFLQSSKVTLTLTSALCGTASEPGIECIDKTYFVIEPLVSLKTVNGLEFAQVGGMGRVLSDEYTYIVLTFEVSVSE